MKSVHTYLTIFLLMAGGLFSCKKDKVPVPAELTKWEKISGNYKVYDTNGVYLYEMQIEHFRSFNQFGNPTDSLEFNNIDGEFILKKKQPQSSSEPEYHISIGSHVEMYDTNMNRWKINQSGDLTFNNFYNDTINLRFTRHNLNYYIEDMIPYQDLDKVQIAVKQH